MTDDLRWAARYAFFEDLWRDQARVIVDAGLEAALRESSSRARGDDESSARAELVDALVPRVPRARTWVAVADEAVARELAQTRPGAGFLPRASFADVVAHREWSVALVELSALADDAPGGPRLREQLAERVRDGRTVIVSARVVPGEEPDDDAAYAELTDLLEDHLGGGRIYGVYRPPMAAVVDFGVADGDGDDADADDEVPLSFDNTLGSQAPAFVEYVAVAGPADELPEGMTLIELPAEAAATDVLADDGLRGRLVQVQRQAELAAIDRQALLEKVDELESAQTQLEQQAEQLRDHLARAVTEDPAAEHDDRLQAAQADNQALRWKVQQLERELMQAKARPVEELEAQVARLQAQLQAATAADLGDEPVDDEADADDDERDEVLDQILVLDHEELLAEAEDRADRIRFETALRQLDRLIARVERGGIGALPLRQALVSLRGRLRG